MSQPPKPQIGRPKAANPKRHLVAVRLTDAQMAALRAVDESPQRAVERLLERAGQEGTGLDTASDVA